MKKLLLSVFLVFQCFYSGHFLFAQVKPTIFLDKTYGGNDQDDLRCMLQTADGGFIMGGQSITSANGDKTQPANNSFDFWVLKLDSSGTKQWDKTFGGNTLDVLASILQTPDGGYILAGHSLSPAGGDKSEPNQGLADYWILKIDATGNKLWDKTLGSNYNDWLVEIQQTPDGGFIVGGTSNSQANSFKSENNRGIFPTCDFWILKLDANGNKIWDKTIGGSEEEQFIGLKQTSDGGFVLAGQSNSGISGDKSQATNGNSDYWLVKLDAAGNKVWDKAFGGLGHDYLYNFNQTNDNGFVLVGSSSSGISGTKSQPSIGGHDFWIVKVNANGTKIWDKTYGGLANDEAGAVQQTAKGEFIVGGSSESYKSGDKSEEGRGDYDFWIVKLDANGNKLADKTIGGTNHDKLVALKINPKEEIFLAGNTFSSASPFADKTSAAKGASDFWLVKLSPYLNLTCATYPATISLDCNPAGTNLKVDIPSWQKTAVNPSWTLNYTQNGIRKTLSDSVASKTFAFNPTAGNVFILKGLTSGRCSLPLAQTLIVPDFPATPFANSVKKCGGNSATLKATGAAKGHRYVWSNKPTGGTPLQADTAANFTTPIISEPTIYYVATQNEMGCESARVQVLVELNYCPPVFIPNLVTPNHDGKNDTFQPANLKGGTWNLQIFNRWGRKIYEAKNYQNTWPEAKVNAGTYYYLLQNSAGTDKYNGWLEVTE